MNPIKLLSLLLCTWVVTGCAVGNKYDYQNADISLPVSGSATLGLGVVDNRSYVLEGKKKPNFIGLQRGGFGNPFDVTTKSGEPLTDDMSKVIAKALSNNGFVVKNLYFSSPDSSIVASSITKNGEEKNVVLTVTEWKTNIYMKMSLEFDLLLQVIAKDGTVIAKNHAKGEEYIGGGGFESQNSRSAAAALETKIGRLFNHKDIINALKS